MRLESKRTTYLGWSMDSRLEGRYARFIDKLGFLEFVYAPERFKLPNGQVYTPDFEILGHPYTFRCFIEVKPTWEIALAEQDRWLPFLLDYGHLTILTGVPGPQMRRHDLSRSTIKTDAFAKSMNADFVDLAKSMNQPLGIEYLKLDSGNYFLHHISCMYAWCAEYIAHLHEKGIVNNESLEFQPESKRHMIISHIERACASARAYRFDQDAA